jgi:hypothetical protein
VLGLPPKIIPDFLRSHEQAPPTFLQRLAEYDSPPCLHPKAGLHTRLSKKRYSFWIIQIVNPSVVVKAGFSIRDVKIHIEIGIARKSPPHLPFKISISKLTLLACPPKVDSLPSESVVKLAPNTYTEASLQM